MNPIGILGVCLWYGVPESDAEGIILATKVRPRNEKDCQIVTKFQRW